MLTISRGYAIVRYINFRIINNNDNDNNNNNAASTCVDVARSLVKFIYRPSSETKSAINRIIYAFQIFVTYWQQLAPNSYRLRPTQCAFHLQ